MPASVGQLLASCGVVLRRLGGVIAAFAPVRLWPALDEHVPVTNSAGLSGILTILSAAAIGIPGFIAYGTEMSAINNKIFLEMAARPEAVGVLDSRTMTGMNGLALFGFLFLTPSGWATMYLGLSGTLRAVAAGVGDGTGDPILTVLDALLVSAFQKTRAGVHRARREALEGPEVPDRVLPGATLGLPEAEIVIVSSRVKSGWDRGTVVVTDEKVYRVGTIVERTLHGRLRTLYPLTEHRDLEAARRSVYYAMPEGRLSPRA